jgi:hypothetical protein
VNVTMMLADSAQAVGGKLYVLGGGWSITGPDPTPMALAIKIEVPWDATNLKHKLRLELVDSDGQAVPAPGQEEQPLLTEGDFKVGRPLGSKPGTPIDFPFAINLGLSRWRRIHAMSGSCRSTGIRTRTGELRSPRVQRMTARPLRRELLQVAGHLPGPVFRNDPRGRERDWRFDALRQGRRGVTRLLLR